MEQARIKRCAGNAKRRGFTLVELLVVISLIIIIAATALPTITKLFTAGADKQAFNMLSAQLSLARAIAIENNTYAGVHIQMSDNPDIEDTCYAAILWDDPATTNHDLSLADGCKPIKFPGGFAFGKLVNPYVTNAGNYIELDNTQLDNFTTMTILFSPSGQVVHNIGTATYISYDTTANNGLFASSISSGDIELWNSPGNQTGTTAVTMFDYTQVFGMDSSNRDKYLNENGQFLCLNVYTGRFFHRD